MSEIIDDFWKNNGTISNMYNVANAASNAHQSEGVSRFGAIGALVKAIMSFFA